MKNKTLKYRLSRVAVLLLTFIMASALILSLAGCTGNRDNDGNIPNDGTPNENDQNQDPNNGNTDPGTDVAPNGTPNSLSGKTAEGQIYHIIRSENTFSSPFMMVTEEGKHYYVNNTQTGSQRSSGEENNGGGSGSGSNGSSTNGSMNGEGSSNGSSNGNSSGTASDNQNTTPNTGNGDNAHGGNVSFELGDMVRIDITEGTDNGNIATVSDCKVTLIEKFQGTLLNANVYTKEGIPAEMLATEGEGASAGWYHQKFDDFSDYELFLSRYDLTGYIESMYNAFSDGTVPAIDEDFFKNNSIHIFAVPYSGEESMTGTDDATLYKSGDTLCLMIKEGGYINYLSGIVDMGKDFMEGVGNAVQEGADSIGDAARDITRGVGDAAKDITNGIGDAAKDITNGAGDAAKDITDGAGNAARDITDGTTDSGTNSGAGNGTDANTDTNTGMGNGTGDNGTGNNDKTNGVYCRFYVVLLGEEGKGLDNGTVLISE